MTQKRVERAATANTTTAPIVAWPELSTTIAMPPELLGGAVCCLFCWALVGIGYNLRILVEWSRKKGYLKEEDIDGDD